MEAPIHSTGSNAVVPTAHSTAATVTSALPPVTI